MHTSSERRNKGIGCQLIWSQRPDVADRVKQRWLVTDPRFLEREDNWLAV
jgi:hypothetical protein